MEQQKDSTGAIIGSVIIIIILIIGGVYFGKKAAREITPAEEVGVINEIVENDPEFLQIEAQTGTASADLEASWNNIDLNGLDNVNLDNL
jgi:hypothetical protein